MADEWEVREWADQRRQNLVIWEGSCSHGKPIEGHGTLTLHGIVDMRVVGDFSNGRFDGQMKAMI